MFQEFGFSSNLPLIVITIVVVALTILCYIESKRVSSEFDNIREKINESIREGDKPSKGAEGFLGIKGGKK